MTVFLGAWIFLFAGVVIIRRFGFCLTPFVGVWLLRGLVLILNCLVCRVGDVGCIWAYLVVALGNGQFGSLGSGVFSVVGCV